MTAELETTEQEDQKPEVKVQGDSSGAVYGLGVIGAWVYFIGRADNFQEGLKGFFKGLFWPAYLVHGLLTFLEKE
jgi:hypothetical protein